MKYQVLKTEAHIKHITKPYANLSHNGKYFIYNLNNRSM